MPGVFTAPTSATFRAPFLPSYEAHRSVTSKSRIQKEGSLGAEPSPEPSDGHDLLPKQLWVRRYANWLFRFRWIVLLLTLGVVAVSGYGVRYLEIDPDTRLFFSRTSPERKALEAMEEKYGKTTDVLIIVAPEDRNVFTPESLSVVSSVTAAAWDVPSAIRVDSLTNYKYSFSRGDEFVVEDLVPEGVPLDDAGIERIRTRALSDPILADQLVSSNGDVTAVNITLVRPVDQRESVSAIAHHVERLMKDLRAQHPGVSFYVTGGVMGDWAFAQATYRDMERLLPLMTLLVVVCLWVGLRSAWSVIAALAVVMLSMLVAMGLAGWFQVTLNSITVGAPIMSTTLAIADCVHLLAGASQLRRKGLSHRDSVAESLRVNWTPILLTSVTTAVSFLTLNFAESPPLQDVGNIVAVGVTAAWLMSITSLPALVIVLPPPTRLSSLSDPRFLAGLASLVLTYRKLLLAASFLIVIVLGIGIPRMTLDDDFIKYFSTSFEFRRDTEFLENRLTGLHAIHYSVPAGEEGGVAQPKYLETVDNFASWFREQPNVSHVSAITDTLKRLNRNMHGDDPQAYTLPETRELAAQYLLLYEMSLPEGFDLNNQVDIGKSASKVTVRVSNVTSGQLKRLATLGEEWLAQRGIDAPATGISVMYADLSENNIRPMILGTFIELVCISLLMIVMVRNLKIGLLSLIPNLSPAFLAFGLWGWLRSEVNLAVSVVAAMTFGIIVDDTIHTLVKYVRARRELGMDAESAVRYTYVTVGEPMLLTGLTLAVGFGILAFSGFAVTHQLGLLSAMIITLAIVADLVMLPPLLVLFDKK